MNEIKNEYRCVTDPAEVKAYLGDSKIVSFDYETAPDDGYRDEDKAALDAAKSHICTLSLSVKEHTGIMIPVAHKVGPNMSKADFDALLTEFLTDRNIIKVAHNLSFEAMFSYAKGIVIMPPVYDTIAAAQMTLKNAYDFRKLSDSGLKKLAGELCGEPLPSFSSVTDGKHFDELDSADEETIRYSCADSDFALRLYHIFNNWFDRFLPKHRFLVEQVESPTAVYLGIMKYNGVPMNLPLMQERKAEADTEMERIRSEIAFMIGDVNIGSNCSTNAFKSYLFNDLGLPVLKTTESNREAADDATMIMLKEWCDVNRPELSHLFDLVQEYRKWNKIASTYIDGYMKYINPATGRIHPNFYALSTDTGRFSCSRPNLQNAPRKTNDPIGVRNFIKAPEGHLIVSCDYSQIELRVGAFYCRDKTMMDTYKSGAISTRPRPASSLASLTSRRRTKLQRITKNTAPSQKTSTSAHFTACSRADSRRPSSSRRGLINPWRNVRRSSQTSKQVIRHWSHGRKKRRQMLTARCIPKQDSADADTSPVFVPRIGVRRVLQNAAV